MRIAILSNGFPPLLDGVGDYSFHLANEFSINGHDVSVICREDVTIQEAVRHGKFTIPVFSIIPSWNWRAIRPLRQLIIQQRPDWLLVQYVPNGYQRWAMPVWFPLLLWLVKREGIKVSITFHEVYVRMTFWPLKHWLIAILQRGICFILTSLADILITSIDLYADLLHNHTHKLIHLIPIGSNILPVPMTEHELLSIRKQIAPHGEYVISTFGLRSQDLLLQVFEEVLEHLPDSRLLICSELKVSLTQQDRYERLKNKIIVTGFMDSPDVYRHLRASDVFFLPDYVNKRGEGGTCNKSTSLATGLMAGLPVVGICGDMNNALLKNVGSIFLEEPDKNRLSEKIIQLFNKRQTYNDVSHQFWKKKLSWSVIAKQHNQTLY